LYKSVPDDCESFIKDILSVCEKANLHHLDLQPSIGATYITTSNPNYEILMRELEFASHIANHSSNHYLFYTKDIYHVLEDELALEASLKSAAHKNEWTIYFQPKIDLLTNQIIGAEALLRWKGNETRITPDVFIPLAEKLGLISQIGRYVIQSTFESIVQLQNIGFSQLKISINLSAQQLMDSDFIDYIDGIAETYCINPDCIIFEITESVLIHNMDKIEKIIADLKKRGFRFSLDDFGTGYSSLAYLSRLSFDELKFDRAFIRDIQHEEKNLIILEHMTKMAHSLGLNIVTEGIEDETQYYIARNLGCNYYQGYYYSRPIPFKNFLELLQAQANQTKIV